MSQQLTSNLPAPAACSRQEFGQMYCISLPTVSRLIRDGKLEACKIGKRTIITAEAEKNWLAALPRAGGKYVLLGDCQKPPALDWLTEKLESVQSVRVLGREAAVLGYTIADLDAARLAIDDVQVTPCLGVDYWRIPDALHERSKTNKALPCQFN